MQSVDDLARAITSLEPSEQRALIDKVAQLNFQRGLHELSEKYRQRLLSQNRLNVPSDEIWSELHLIRKEIADDDYPA
jgi:hypothetical protein